MDVRPSQRTGERLLRPGSLATNKEWLGQVERATTCWRGAGKLRSYDSATTRHFQVMTCRREESGIKGAGAFRVGRVAAHRVPGGRGVSGLRVSPALGPHTLGPLLAPPA